MYKTKKTRGKITPNTTTPGMKEHTDKNTPETNNHEKTTPRVKEHKKTRRGPKNTKTATPGAEEIKGQRRVPENKKKHKCHHNQTQGRNKTPGATEQQINHAEGHRTHKIKTKGGRVSRTHAADQLVDGMPHQFGGMVQSVHTTPRMRLEIEGAD